MTRYRLAPRLWIARSVVSGVVSIFLVAALAATATAAPATWQRDTRLPQTSLAAAAASMNGRIYLIGGIHNPTTPGSRSVIAYNPLTARWTARAALPELRVGATAVGVNGHVYLIGGDGPTGDATPTLYMYHPKQNRWSVEPSAPVPTYNSPAVAATNPAGHPIIILFTGRGDTITTATKSYNIGWTLTYSYDTVTKQWAQLATSPEGMANGGAAGIIDGVAYVNMRTRTTLASHGSCRPAAHDNDTAAYQSCVWEYDPGADVWTPLAAGAQPYQMTQFGAVSSDGRLVVFGEGPLSMTGPADPRAVEVFDPIQKAWQNAPDTIATHDYGAIVAMGTRIYAIGGRNTETDAPTRVVESINTTP